MTSMTSTSLPESQQTLPPVLCLSEIGPLVATFCENGAMIVRRGKTTIAFDNVETMHLANAILARSQEQSQSPYAEVVQTTQDDEARRAFLDSVVGDPEYEAYLEHKDTPSAEHY